MKYSTTILIFLGVVNARYYDLVFLDNQLDSASDSESGKLGSLEDAFLQQRLKRLHRSTSIEMLQINNKKWDGEILGLVDENEYNKEVKTTLSEQELNIEIENENLLKTSIKKEVKPVAKKVVPKVQMIVQKSNSTKQTYNEKIGNEYRDNNHNNGIIVRTNEDSKLVQQKLNEQKSNKMKLEKIKKEKEETLMKLAMIKNQKEQKFKADVGAMNKDWDQFCRTFNTENYNSALAKWAAIEEEGIHPIDLLKVNTKQIYEKEAFSFPDVAKNDFASEQLSTIDAAQTNLNQDLNNQVLLDKFISISQDSIKNLRREYGDVFVGVGSSKTEQNVQVSKEEEE